MAYQLEERTSIDEILELATLAKRKKIDYTLRDLIFYSEIAQENH